MGAWMCAQLLAKVGIALVEAGRTQLSLPGSALANQFYVAFQTPAGGANGTQSLIRALASLSGLDWERRSET
jgi:3-hydroxyisobutyrate dehydrogenase